MRKEDLRLKCVINALHKLGGEAHYSELYEEVIKCKEYGVENFSTEQSFQANVRRLIQEHSSDSSIYKGHKQDIFYSVFGLGKGVWGLRNFKK